MAHRGTPFEKVLSAGDRNDRFSVPASWRDQLLPQAPENGTASVRVLDDKGDWYDFVLKVRKKQTKPEFMAKGWKRFVRNRKLFPGDIISFFRGESPGSTFRVRVLEVGPSLQLALVPSPPEPQPTPPTANLISHLSSAGSDAPPLPTASLFDPPADESDIGGTDIPEKMQAPSAGELGGACIRLFGKVISAA